MQPDLYYYLQQRADLLHFVRMNPQWYRELTRDPSRIYDIEKEAKYFYGKTVPQRIEKLSSQMQMVSMIIQMAGAMKD
ncbi:YlbE-like family protein [Aquibacillus salsiterrae]|uniref:YlbE-like family protein n=1 Tax=Aquibacillus salsiterrae TaxID=2950439 RepID=A0A9X3WCQ2_9BACI|nr:YlbE-like family protein [Aquibacillus salsiterrae]MDC3416503.1 YlbE-like family protein [Aquibacillus salsiterrae]